MKPLIGAGGPGSRAADAEQALITRLSTLAPALDGEPDPEWRSATRTRLVAMAAVRAPEPRAGASTRRLLTGRVGRRGVWRTRLTAGLAGTAAAVTGVAVGVQLSADSRPGDALYGLKRGTEQTQLALAGDARGRTLLGFASTRLEELSVVLPESPPADVVADTLATMDEQTADGAAWLARRALDAGSSAPLDELSGWSAGQSTGLDGVRSDVPPAADDDLVDSAELLSRIEERVAALRVALDCPSGPVVEGSDALGPVPAPCPPAAPVGDGDRSTTGTDRPGTTETAGPTRPVDGTAAPDGGPGPGSAQGGTGPGRGTGPNSGSDPGPGPGDAPRPGVDRSDPAAPGLPRPSLPTPLPGPDIDVRPPAAGTAGGSSTPRDTLPDLDVCPSPLPVTGAC